MTETRIRLLMGFFLCTAIVMLTLSEISKARAGSDEPAPGCQLGHNEMPGFPGPFAGAPRNRPPMPAIPPILPNPQELGLTEAQQDKLFSLAHAQAPLLRKQLKIADKAEEELHQLALVHPFDKTMAQEVAKTRADAMAKVAIMQAELEAAMRDSMSPVQLEKLDTCRPCANPPQ